MKTKKSLLFISVVFMMLSLAGCGKDSATQEIDNNAADVQEEASAQKDNEEEKGEAEDSVVLFDTPIGPVWYGQEGETPSETEPEDASDMKMDDIFDMIEGAWSSKDDSVSVTFYEESDKYFARVSGEGVETFESAVKYIDAAEDEGGLRIRFVTGRGVLGSCRELILSDDGATVSYLIDREKNSEDKIEEVYSVCYKA